MKGIAYGMRGFYQILSHSIPSHSITSLESSFFVFQFLHEKPYYKPSYKPHQTTFIGWFMALATYIHHNKQSNDPTNNVLWVQIDGPVWYTIYHQLPVVKGVVWKPSLNPKWEFGTSIEGFFLRENHLQLKIPSKNSILLINQPMGIWILGHLWTQRANPGQVAKSSRYISNNENLGVSRKRCCA